ncbi:MAG: protein kinase [Planctomycetes bacterium]|nr:protein kinase [Planctomycetota bacterium]
MTTVPPADDTAFADLLDDLFAQLLDGHEPDLAAAAARHPTVAHRIVEAASLASSTAGRRSVARPSLPGYEIVRELGRGGMGTVYLARQTALAREVALKVLPNTFAASTRSRQRFVDEARALARLDHPHVVTIHRILDEGDVLAFEMEFVDGPSLQQLLDHLRQHGQRTGAPPALAPIADLLGLPVAHLGARHPTQFFVRLLTKVANALAVVHAAGLVHRDVKPANVLLRRNGEPVLVDFGLVQPSVPERRQGEGFVGTPVYSAPEQLRGDPDVGPAADVYALAVTLHECLTLQKPFAGQSTTDLLRRIESGRCVPLRRLAPGAPRDLETVLAHAMQVDPSRRYPQAGALADDLQRLQDLQPIRARPPGPVRRLAQFARRQRAPLLAAGLGAALVAAATLAWLDRAEGARQRRVQAHELAQHAQQQLLTGRGRKLAWLPTGGGLARQADPGAQEALHRAHVDYAQAAELDPADASIRGGRDVVRLALWLRQFAVTEPDALRRSVEGGDLARLTSDLGPLTRRTAQRLALGTLGEDLPAEDLLAAAPEDRESVGLLGFLVGDFDTCERALQGLPPERRDRPLVDAVLGLVHLADGSPTLAYPHLLQAHHHFATSSALVLGMAEAALALGDVELARHWLQRVGEADGPLRRCLELDLRLAGEGGPELEGEYERLAQTYPGEPTPRHRLAQLAWRRGDPGRAAALLDGLVAAWPAIARFRLERARLALQQRDLASYATQVFAVLDEDFGRRRSRGSRADLLEILRLGGLDRLATRGRAEDPAGGVARAVLGGEIPVRAFVPGWLADHYEALLPLLHAARSRTREWLAREHPLRHPLGEALLDFLHLVACLPAPPCIDWRLQTAAALAPALVPPVFPLLLELSLAVEMRFSPRNWQRTPLQAPPKPVDLPPSLVWGHALVRIDDRNGDGLPEVLAGVVTQAPRAARGLLAVLDGRSAAVLARVEGDSDEHMFGHAIAALGDVDGDGAADWLVGAPAGTPGTRHGTAEVWSGGTRQRLARLDGDGPGFGVAVVGLDDVDGDGVPDFAVGTAPILRNTAAQGQVDLYSGASRRWLRTLRNDVPGVWFGACLAALGDVDGDGIGELAVGGNFGGAPGLVRLYSPVSGAVLRSWSDDDREHGFGAGLLGLGDIDGDGRADLAISAVRDDSGRSADELVLVSTATGERLRTFRGTQPGSRFGATLARVVGPAGRQLLAVGSPLGGPGATGTVEVIDPVGRLVSTLRGPMALGQFAGAIASSGDTDGDGWPELFVGGPVDGGRGQIWRLETRDAHFPRRQ